MNGAAGGMFVGTKNEMKRQFFNETFRELPRISHVA
jgi:hypothetical protein